MNRWQWLDDELVNRFGSRTKSSVKYHGLWKNPKTGQTISDESVQFFVAVPSERLDELRALLSTACGKFAQQCIYLSVAGYVEFIEPEP
jgi:hypothetical protein